MEKINSEGLPPRIRYKDKLNYFERVDILSQTLRLIIIHLNSIKIDKIFSHKVNRLLKNIISYQFLNNKSVNIRGGFSWGKKVMEKIQKMLIHGLLLLQFKVYTY